jgi:hypothetical protein
MRQVRQAKALVLWLLALMLALNLKASELSQSAPVRVS